MHTTIATAILCTLMMFTPHTNGDDVAGINPPARLHGTIHYLGGTWPVRVELDQAENTATMCFPALGVAGLETTATMQGDALTLSMPYGLGEQRLNWTDDAYRTETTPTNRDAIAIVLEADTLPPPTITSMNFESAATTLAASMWIPGDHTSGLLPLIVLGHGAEPFSREMPEYIAWADHLVRQGYAVFLYDKRGVGESGGSNEHEDIQQLTADFVAAAQTAIEHPLIDRERVAWLGASQFGWIAFAAARTIDVDVLVLSAVPAVDPSTLELRVLADLLRARGIVGDDFADAMAYVRAYFAATRHPVLFDSLLELADQSADTPWIEHVPVPTALDDLAWWGRHAILDPEADIRAFAGSVFIAYGWEDTVATPEINALRHRHILGEQLTLWIADEGNHRLEVPSKMVGDTLRFPQLAPGYLDRVDAFLAKHLQR